MRPLPALVLAGLLAATPAIAATPAPPLTLRTVLIDGQSELFSIADSTGAGRWATLGDNIDGWRLSTYNDARKILTLVRGDETLELRLASAQITDDRSTTRQATLAEADALLQKMRFEEMISETLEAQQAAMAKNMGRMLGTGLDEQERADFVEFQRKVMKTLFDEMDLPGMRKELAQVYADTFSQAELNAMSDFYSTPAGRAMIDKQPALQQRMTELMMPRMMRAMPKIQEMARTHAEEQTARKNSAGAAPDAK